MTIEERTISGAHPTIKNETAKKNKPIVTFLNMQASLRFTTVCIALLLGGCTTVPVASVSDERFESLNCSELLAEETRLATVLRAATGVESDKANSDALIAATAVVISPLAMVFYSSNAGVSVEVSRIRGELNAITRVKAKKSC